MEPEQQTPGQRALELMRVLLPNRQPATQDVLRWIRIAIAVSIVIVGVLLILDVVSSIFGIKLWNLLKVLAVPITVGAAVPWLNWLQKKREQVVADQRAQDDALQAYLDQMSQLLLDEPEPLRRSVEGDDIRTLARARTLTILRRLAPDRKRNVLDFLYEADLIKRIQPIISLGSTDFFKSVADLSRAALIGADLKGVDLSGGVNLSGADLRCADLRGANLTGSNLKGADLSGAFFFSDPNDPTHVVADLRGVDLRDAYLIGTNFSGASVQLVKLSGAYLQRTERATQEYAAELRAAGLPDDRIAQAIGGQAEFRHVNLSGADLRGVNGLTQEQLEQAREDQIIKVPDHLRRPEKWLKDQGGRREAGGNIGPS